MCLVFKGADGSTWNVKGTQEQRLFSHNGHTQWGSHAAARSGAYWHRSGALISFSWVKLLISKLPPCFSASGIPQPYSETLPTLRPRG